MTAVLYVIVFIGLGALFAHLGWVGGKKAARMEDKLKAMNSCKEAGEIPFINCSPVSCPCQCGGILQNDGRNKIDTLTFLMCSRCSCAYVAGDNEKIKLQSAKT